MHTRAENGHGVTAATKNLSDHAVALARLELGLALAGAGVGLATALPTWLALLVVAGAVFLVAGVLGVLGLSAVKRGVPPVPEQAIAEAKATTEAVKSNGHR